MRITKVERCDGFHTARVSINGATVGVSDQYGSWTTTAAPERDLVPDVAERLQVRCYGTPRGRGRR